MASIRKNLHLRAFDSTAKKFGILHRSELVILSAQDERGEANFLNLIHQVEPITGEEIAVEDFRPASEHISDAPFDKHRQSLPRVGKLSYLSNGLLKIILDPV